MTGVWVQDHKFNFGTGSKASADMKCFVIQLGSRIRELCKEGKVNLYDGPKEDPSHTEIFRATFGKIAGFSEKTLRAYEHEMKENDNYVFDAEPTRKKRRLELEYPTLCGAVCKLVDEAKVGGFLTKAKIHASLTQQFGFSCSERHAVGEE